MNDQIKKLTPADPLDEETKQKLDELTEMSYDIAIKLYESEQAKVRLLVAGRQVDVEKQKLFEKILMDRGLPPNTPVEIDGQTGMIKVLHPIGARPSEAAPS